jgi:CheY-like chemotaxis protein
MPKVLLADDEPDFLLVMEKLLKKHGYEVAEAIDGKGALRKAASEKPDALLLDIMMPDITGWEVCRELKGNPGTKDLPIIMLSVMAEDEFIKKSFDYAGADWHITKPFDINTLFFILKMAAQKEKMSEVERKINLAVEKDRKMKAAYKMILDHKYDFLKNN